MIIFSIMWPISTDLSCSLLYIFKFLLNTFAYVIITQLLSSLIVFICACREERIFSSQDQCNKQLFFVFIPVIEIHLTRYTLCVDVPLAAGRPTVWVKAFGCQSARASWFLQWSCPSTPSPAVRQTCWWQKTLEKCGELITPPVCVQYTLDNGYSRRRQKCTAAVTEGWLYII